MKDRWKAWSGTTKGLVVGAVWCVLVATFHELGAHSWDAVAIPTAVVVWVWVLEA